MANRLADETSPYLRQHAENPVDWYPWSDEAFERARSLDRPVLVSVGYSSCHWCHVMAHESFEDEPTAELVNELFVSVKVDREERPDVDAVYMDAVQAMTGRGGWPMTVFVTPDGRPFFAGTYFPREPQGGMLSFTDLCRRIDEVWRTRRTEIEEQADTVANAIASGSDLEPSEELPEATTLADAATALRSQFDARWGGFGAAPKFPQAMSLDLLARGVARSGSAEDLEVLTTSLDAMASGGIYDHLGGGFARYSVDERWLVPHFEKMLYDQALLVRVYLHAWQLTGEPRYRQVLDETVAYVLRDLRRPSGGVASAQDADSDDGTGHQSEGAFYVWSADELRSTLAAAGFEDGDITQALEWWGVTDTGNFEGRNILWRPVRGDLVRPEAVERARQLLFEARLARPRPGLDDKVLTEWNGLWIAALAEAAAATGDELWRQAAVEDGERLLAVLRRPDGRWLRSWQDDGEGGGEARHLAYAADHAALVDAFVRLAELTGEARWIDEARSTADAMLALFTDDEHGGLFTTGSDAEQLITRPKDLLDNATPSANSLAALGLLRLAALTGERRYREEAEGILRLLAGPAARHPTAFAHLLAAVDLHVTGATEVVVSGDRPDLVEAVRSAFRPDVVLAWGERYDSPLWEGREETGADGRAYVCRGFVCDAPTATPSATQRVLGTVTPQGSGSSTRNEATLSDRRDDAENWAR